MIDRYVTSAAVHTFSCSRPKRTEKKSGPCRHRGLHTGAFKYDFIANSNSSVLTNDESVSHISTARIPHGIQSKKASGLPSGWDEIMNHSFGTMREPRHRYQPSLALIILSLARAVVGPAEPLSVRNHAVIPGPGPNFLGRACKESTALPCCAIG
jgi:hypothetical protein